MPGGIKLLRSVAQSDEYGMVNIDMPLADRIEPWHVWKIVAQCEGAKSRTRHPRGAVRPRSTT